MLANCKLLYTVRLSGLMSGNDTASFTGFMITAKNEFEDEENGQFICLLGSPGWNASRIIKR